MIPGLGRPLIPWSNSARVLQPWSLALRPRSGNCWAYLARGLKPVLCDKRGLGTAGSSSPHSQWEKSTHSIAKEVLIIKKGTWENVHRTYADILKFLEHPGVLASAGVLVAVPCRYEGTTCVPVYSFHSSLDGHFKLCDTLLAILNNILLNIRAQISVQVLLSILLAIYLAVVLLGRLIFRILFFLK